MKYTIITIICILSFTNAQSQNCNFVYDGSFEDSLFEWETVGSPDVYPANRIFMWSASSKIGNEHISQTLCADISVPSPIGNFDLSFDARTSNRNNGWLEIRLVDTTGNDVVLHTLSPPQLTTTVKSYTIKNVLDSIPSGTSGTYSKIIITPICGSPGIMDIVVDNIVLKPNSQPVGKIYSTTAECCHTNKVNVIPFPGKVIWGRNVVHEWFSVSQNKRVDTGATLEMMSKAPQVDTYIFKQSIYCYELNVDIPCSIIATDTVVVHSFPLSVTENKASEFKASVYPNPFTNMLHIELPVADVYNVSVSLTDNLGRVIKKVEKAHVKHGNNNLVIDTKSIQTGLYYIIIDCEAGRYIQKVIHRD